ncbi:MAG: cytochrome D ubiquinol oxidase subunit II [Methylothermaceae bacteria B42]|nr:MAG: cytochrome D ubiquinol oxidase subunit II [Methylothermaceae bacteria B42]HHJ39274.1 TIGR00730 family Rossman fold protein [Methylothermaceae bacterium]
MAEQSPSHPLLPKPVSPQRLEPLPWQAPKPPEEDPDAPRRVQQILASPSYRPAVQDVQFLNRYETRPARLQLDYMKPELGLQENGVRNTIVVFGSTRIPEPAAAKRKLAVLKEALAKRPDSGELQQRVKVAEKIAAKSRYYDIAREFGRLVGHAGHGPLDCRLVVMTGGGPGMMEAANRGAFDVGAKTVGLNITLPHEQFPNPYITPELCFQFHYFALRKMHFLLRAKALVVFPGGYGTFDELFETLTLVQTRKIRPLPVVLVGKEYWQRAVNFDFLVEEGTIDPEDKELFWYAETAQEIWDGIVWWYESNGESLINGEPFPGVAVE